MQKYEEIQKHEIVLSGQTKVEKKMGGIVR